MSDYQYLPIALPSHGLSARNKSRYEGVMHTFSNVKPGIESEPSLKYRFGRTGCINLRRVSSLVLGMLVAACISRHHDEGAVSSCWRLRTKRRSPYCYESTVMNVSNLAGFAAVRIRQ